MASDRQLQANRANAKKSTGPRTDIGKSRSRLNSRKHGLTAKMLITIGENADDFDQLRTELLEQHDPQSSLEFELVERLAGILWRLRRVPFFEAAILDARHAQVSEEDEGKAKQEYWKHHASEEADDEGEDEDEEQSDWVASVHFGRALINDAGWSDALGKLARHETTLMNALTKTLEALLLLREERLNQSWKKNMIIEATVIPPLNPDSTP